MLVSTRVWTIELSLQILLLVCLEFAVDELKVQLCDKHGVPVRHLRPRLRGNTWFVLALILEAVAVALASLCGLRADCYLNGPL